MKASEILQKHEDANEMHLHHVDRRWVIEAMEEYKNQAIKLPSDEEIQAYFKKGYGGDDGSAIYGAKWMRDKIKG